MRNACLLLIVIIVFSLTPRAVRAQGTTTISRSIPDANASATSIEIPFTVSAPGQVTVRVKWTSQKTVLGSVLPIRVGVALRKGDAKGPVAASVAPTASGDISTTYTTSAQSINYLVAVVSYAAHEITGDVTITYPIPAPATPPGSSAPPAPPASPMDSYMKSLFPDYNEPPGPFSAPSHAFRIISAKTLPSPARYAAVEVTYSTNVALARLSICTDQRSGVLTYVPVKNIDPSYDHADVSSVFSPGFDEAGNRVPSEAFITRLRAQPAGVRTDTLFLPLDASTVRSVDDHPLTIELSTTAPSACPTLTALRGTSVADHYLDRAPPSSQVFRGASIQASFGRGATPPNPIGTYVLASANGMGIQPISEGTVELRADGRYIVMLKNDSPLMSMIAGDSGTYRIVGDAAELKSADSVGNRRFPLSPLELKSDGLIMTVDDGKRDNSGHYYIGNQFTPKGVSFDKQAVAVTTTTFGATGMNGGGSTGGSPPSSPPPVKKTPPGRAARTPAAPPVSPSSDATSDATLPVSVTIASNGKVGPAECTDGTSGVNVTTAASVYSFDVKGSGAHRITCTFAIDVPVPVSAPATTGSPAAGSGRFRVQLPSGVATGKATYCAVAGIDLLTIVFEGDEVNGTLMGRSKSKPGTYGISSGADDAFQVNIIRTKPEAAMYPASEGQVVITSWTNNVIVGTFRTTGQVKDVAGLDQPHSVNGSFSAVPMEGCGG